LEVKRGDFVSIIKEILGRYEELPQWEKDFLKKRK